jgi:hypothetical protein
VINATGSRSDNGFPWVPVIIAWVVLVGGGIFAFWWFRMRPRGTVT